ncbi:helix-turn-helix transcriptional regulator [Stenotrophomonas maltophilia]|jgi:transcriptional regulator with XRE-family HTH domain|uniref:helix-turn-helix domain-containing protein n=1 Tax=Stenotrophomonas maltophilia TaxID=40324 RepID=UPI0015DDE4B1|nr:MULTISPECIES: helix-turn-helix transcriptional regulator [Stenotrophomonas]MBA0274717.1 XRE family transcriptional regulator [Stenotrophomonas maltophilia]MBH1429786.1 helix-turn-helix transcriptional regulator [Stenotrophomonas maltophilia]MBH1541718.1 helix-turn-helix transcriptional regulator [Stenotrophomonas maltophilia]MBN4983982.1 helix-turn-helix transcriptional regulator [Stenotrophomonas maltophilia]
MPQSTHNSDYQLLLAVLKAARKRAGVSQVDLASRLGNTQTFVSKCERGERRIDAVELVEFAEALGIAPQNLLAEYLDLRGGKSSAKAGKGKKSRGN